MEALYVRVHQEHVQSWLVPGRRHSDVILDPDYGSRVMAFLREHLFSGQASISAENRHTRN